MRIERKKNVAIIQNTELGSHLPLSVYLTDLLRNYKSEQKVSLICATGGTIPIEFGLKKENIYQIFSDLYSIKANISFFLKSFITLKKINNFSALNIVHCFYPNSSLLAAVFFKLLINNRVKIIYDVRSPWIQMIFARNHIRASFLNKFFIFLLYVGEFILTRFVNHFIFITPSLHDYYSKILYLKNREYTIIPSGVDTKLFQYVSSTIREKKNFKKSDIVIGVVSSLTKARQLNFLLESTRELLKVSNRYKLFFIGEGEERDALEQYTERLNISGSVIFEGRVKHEDMPKYISTFDVGICHIPDFFVYRRSFPLKILEYLSCGIPVLATNIAANVEISQKFEGIYIYNFQKEDFVSKVKSIKQHDVAEIREQLTKNYDWKFLGKKYEDVYRKY